MLEPNKLMTVSDVFFIMLKDFRDVSNHPDLQLEVEYTWDHVTLKVILPESTSYLVKVSAVGLEPARQKMVAELADRRIKSNKASCDALTFDQRITKLEQLVGTLHARIDQCTVGVNGLDTRMCVAEDKWRSFRNMVNDLTRALNNLAKDRFSIKASLTKEAKCDAPTTDAET